MYLSNTRTTRAVLVAAAFAGSTAAQALTVPDVGGVLDFTAYKATFSSSVV